MARNMQHLLLLLALWAPFLEARSLQQDQAAPQSVGDQIVHGLQDVGEGVACFFTFGLLNICNNAAAAPQAPSPPAPQQTPAEPVCPGGVLLCCPAVYLAANPSDPCCSPSACGAPTPAPAPAPAPAPQPDAAALATVLPADGSAELFGSDASSASAAAAAGDPGSSTPVGAIVGGVVGGLAAVALALGLFLLDRRRQDRKYATHDVNRFLSQKAATLPGGLPGSAAGAPASPKGAELAAAGAAAVAVSAGSPGRSGAAGAGSEARAPEEGTALGPLGSAVMAVELTAASSGPTALAASPAAATAAVTASKGQPLNPASLGPLGAAWAGVSRQADLDSARGLASKSGSGREKKSKDLAGPSDKLLSFVTTTLSTFESGTATGGMSWQEAAAKELGPELQPWSLQFTDLHVARLIGEGSFGRVYAADLRGERVAVKLLMDPKDTVPGSDSASAQTAVLSNPVLRQLRQEASLMAELEHSRHPNILRFKGVCGIPPAVVTEYCANGSLADLLAKAVTDPGTAALLTWQRRLSIALGAAEGMLCLHTHTPEPIVHGDLKSANLLLDSNWTVKVSDFSLSKLAQSKSAGSTATGTGAGSSSGGGDDGSSAFSLSPRGALNPRWTAPELLTGSAPAGLPADVYSFAVCLYELLTWRLPWDSASNPWAIVNAVAAGDRPLIPEPALLPGPQPAPAWTGLPAYLALLQRCWAQRPEDRPAFAAVVQELRALADTAAEVPFEADFEAHLGRADLADLTVPAAGPPAEPAAPEAKATSTAATNTDAPGTDASPSADSAERPGAAAVAAAAAPPLGGGATAAAEAITGTAGSGAEAAERHDAPAGPPAISRTTTMDAGVQTDAALPGGGLEPAGSGSAVPAGGAKDHQPPSMKRVGGGYVAPPRARKSG